MIHLAFEGMSEHTHRLLHKLKKEFLSCSTQKQERIKAFTSVSLGLAVF